MRRQRWRYDTGAPDLSPRRLKILNVVGKRSSRISPFDHTKREDEQTRFSGCEDEETTVFEMKGLTKVMNVPQRKNVKGIAAINSDAVNACVERTEEGNDEKR